MTNLNLKLNCIIYNTISDYRNSTNFGKYKLEEYDNWKDTIIDKIDKYVKRNYKQKNG